MRIVVVGGSLAGLGAALMLARDGHEVVVADRDALEPAQDVEEAAATAFRVAAPQIVHPNVMHPLGRNLILDRLPDVYAGLLEAGVLEYPLAERLPPTLPERSSQPGDEHLTMLLSRRSTVDWVFRRAAAAEPGVTLRGGMRVTGLVAERGAPVRVIGVRTDRGDLAADVVIDAAGRRTPVQRWLADIGARRPEAVEAECGLAYYSRRYRLRPGARLPASPTVAMVLPLRQFIVVLVGGDHNTMTMAIAPLAEDRPFRAARHADAFTAVARTVPSLAQWLDALEPITSVAVMGGLHNTLLRLVVDGAPVALGLHAVGDAVCTTNPTFGRGTSLALQGTADLADVLAKHPDDALEQAHAMDQAITDHIAPWYAEQAAADSARLAMLRHTLLGAPSPPPGDQLTVAQLGTTAPFDPMVFRAFATFMGMLRAPGEILRDPQLITRVREILATHTGPAVPEPTREQLRTALAG